MPFYPWHHPKRLDRRSLVQREAKDRLPDSKKLTTRTRWEWSKKWDRMTRWRKFAHHFMDQFEISSRELKELKKTINEEKSRKIAQLALREIGVFDVKPPVVSALAWRLFVITKQIEFWEYWAPLYSNPHQLRKVAPDSKERDRRKLKHELETDLINEYDRQIELQKKMKAILGNKSEEFEKKFYAKAEQTVQHLETERFDDQFEPRSIWD